MPTTPLTDSQRQTLRAVIDRLIPADDHPGALEVGTDDYVLNQLGGDLRDALTTFRLGLDALNAESAARHSVPFASLSPSEQDALLAAVEGDDVLAAWHVPPARFLRRLIHLAAEGYYADPANGGNRGAASWRMLGFDPRTDYPAPPASPTAPAARSAPPTPDDCYDVIVVGAGAAGGIVAAVLAEAGKRVLLLERGRHLSTAGVPRDHLRNHRLALYGHNTGPEIEGNPRVFVDAYGQSHVVRPHEGGYNHNASCVGGGTLVYGAQAWRFMPQDFRMASLYGTPEGSSLTDWPITYEDLEPFYERAEWEVGVAGDAAANRFAGPRRHHYPMPPVPTNLQRQALQPAAERLGWNAAPPPLLINTVPYLGRPACIQCGECVGFSCPSNGKNGTHNTMVPRALATGNCTLVPQAVAEQITTSASGHVTGVTYLTESPAGRLRRTAARAKVVVVSAGAVESARLLLNSATDQHPRGLGNEHDWVGRNFQGHYYSGAFGLMPDDVYDGLGPGVSIATCQFNHGNPGIVGGGLLANEFIKLPIIFWRGALPPGAPLWGEANKRLMREHYRRTMHVYGPTHDVPNPEARVMVDPAVRDRFGLPVARLSGTVHPETLRTADFLRHRAEDWLRAAGAERVWSTPPRLGLTGGQHQAGTCRMGTDPRSSVTNPLGRVHAHDNLYVVDGSLHVTNGGFNPVLTIMALAFRSAEHLARAL